MVDELMVLMFVTVAMALGVAGRRGQSSTTNPRSADKLVREVVKKVAAEMKKAGLIQEGGSQ